MQSHRYGRLGLYIWPHEDSFVPWMYCIHHLKPWMMGGWFRMALGQVVTPLCREKESLAGLMDLPPLSWVHTTSFPTQACLLSSY